MENVTDIIFHPSNSFVEGERWTKEPYAGKRNGLDVVGFSFKNEGGCTHMEVLTNLLGGDDAYVAKKPEGISGEEWGLVLKKARKLQDEVIKKWKEKLKERRGSRRA